MWELQKSAGRRIASAWTALTRRAPAPRRAPGPAADWLPPVLGPADWSSGLMADRSAGWYFDRD